jgi:antitoxin component YwqK of YwqJK toxin-antitoxin module
MKTAERVLSICLLAVLFVCNWTYPGYCKEKTRKEYYPDGKVKAVYTYNDAGLLDGVLKRYYKSGELKSEIPHQNNRATGIEKDYYKSGKLRGETNWEDGERNGMSKTYYENGKLRTKLNLKDGKPLSSTCYDDKGNEIQCSPEFIQDKSGVSD